MKNYVKKSMKTVLLAVSFLMISKTLREPPISVLAAEINPETYETTEDLWDSEEQPEPNISQEEPAGPITPEVPYLSASVSQAEHTQAASIHWEPVSGACAYQIERSTEKDGDFSKIASLDADRDNYTDKKTENGWNYYYRITAEFENGSTCGSEVLSFSCPLSKITNVKLIRYSTSEIKAVWDKSDDKQAAYYKVYYAKSKDGDYKLAGTTKNNSYLVSNLKNNQNYYFRVNACTEKKSSGLDSPLSKAVKMRTKPYSRTTIFAGDSLTVGFRTYNILNEIAIGGNKRVVAAVGLNTITFRTRRVFNGKSGLESIVSSKPYRVYIMLGDNDIHYRSKEDVVAGYKEILKGIRAGSPDTDIVVLAATPVTSAQVEKRKGFAQIPAYNQSLKSLAESMGAKFYDCTDFLKDTTGWLKSSYAAGDGIHWTAAAYRKYAKLLEAYDLSLDKNH